MAPKYSRHSTSSKLIDEFADNIKDKVILVTGTSPGGLGALYCVAVAKASPSLIILAGRNDALNKKTEEAVKGVNVNVKTRLLNLDLASFENIREAAAQVMSWGDVPYIDLLVNNAGIMAVPYGKTEDGFERQFGVNHLGHFLFTNLIMSKILASKTPRVVMVSSAGHRINPIRWTDYNFSDGKSYNKWLAYGQSKTANILMALALAERLRRRGLLAFSLDPGIFVTNLSRDLDMSDPEVMQSLYAADASIGNKAMHPDYEYNYNSEDEIIATHVFCSFCDDIKGHNGGYFTECHLADQYEEEVYPWANNAIDADRLWTLSEKLVGERFAY
ncbi:short-chain dehydrogenase/ reductase [Mariannaea sp. PMI_226]|nr:short-chain dehydrogenase/ reductase [Mariannaea sp. PMI_226]